MSAHCIKMCYFFLHLSFQQDCDLVKERDFYSNWYIQCLNDSWNRVDHVYMGHMSQSSWIWVQTLKNLNVRYEHPLCLASEISLSFPLIFIGYWMNFVAAMVITKIKTLPSHLSNTITFFLKCISMLCRSHMYNLNGHWHFNEIWHYTILCILDSWNRI